MADAGIRRDNWRFNPTEKTSVYCRNLILPGLLLVMLLSGCGVVRKATHPAKTIEQTLGHPPTLDLTVDVAADANNDSPVAFDLVLAKDKELVKQLSTMTAADWFKKRVQIERDSQAKIQVHSWEWVPGQDVGKIPVPVTVEVLGAIGFANYSTPGDHRAVLSLNGSELMAFQQADFSVTRAR